MQLHTNKLFRIFGTHSRLVVLAMLVVTGQFCGTAAAQESAPPPLQTEEKGDQNKEKLLTEADLTPEDLGIDVIATITDLGELRQKWVEVDKQMNESLSAFNATSDAAAQVKIRSEYDGMVKKANSIVSRIKEVAFTEYEKDSSNKKALNMLMGTLVNDAQFSLKDEFRQRAAEVITMGDKLIKCGIDGKYFETAAKVERLDTAARELFEELQIRHRESQADDLPRVRISTSKGDMVVELFENEAPNAVANFISLAEKDFYDDLKFHRVMEGFMAQGGCPEGNGTGGPGYKIECECYSPDARRHFVGSLSMAHAGKNSGGSQFFITFERPENPDALDGVHTVFGKVVEGLDVLNSLTRTYTKNNQPIQGTEADTIKSMEVLRKREHEYKPRKVGDPEPEPETEEPPADPTAAKAEASEEKSEDMDEKEEAEEKEAAESEEGSDKSSDESEESGDDADN